MPASCTFEAGFAKKLSLTAISVIFCILILGIAELACRAFLDINLRKTSKEFMILDNAGRPAGNSPNARGISFGAKVFSDSNGFRVPENYSYPNAEKAVLLLGDSVTFGVGVPEEKTFAGLLRNNNESVKVYNAAVNGFSLPDYSRTARELLHRYTEINEVYLFYCLNDFREIGQSEETRTEDSGITSIKRLVSSVFAAMNEIFGPRSKLYVLITGLTTDPSRRYYDWDLSIMNAASDRFDDVMKPIVEINDLVKDRGGRFTVFLNPYEFQLRPDGGGFTPQEQLTDFLKSKGISHVDTRERFAQLPRPAEAFLFADPMHLSERGHQLVFDALKDHRQRLRVN